MRPDPPEALEAYGDAAMMNRCGHRAGRVRQTPNAGSARRRRRRARGGLGPASAAVEIGAGANTETVYVRVSDRGLGIDPSYVERASSGSGGRRANSDPQGDRGRAGALSGPADGRAAERLGVAAPARGRWARAAEVRFARGGRVRDEDDPGEHIGPRPRAAAGA